MRPETENIKETEANVGGSGGRSFLKKFFLPVVALVVLSVVAYVNSGKVPQSVSSVVAMVIVLLILGLQFYSVAKSKPQKRLEDLGDDDGGIDWRGTGAKDVVVETRDGWAVLIGNCPVEEAASVAKRLETAGIRVRLEVLQVQRVYHLWSIHCATRMCVLVPPSEYERAMRLVADLALGKDKCD
jgi:hypothetical protein